MVTSTKPPGGTRDFLPTELRRRRRVISIIEGVYERYGFSPLATPAFENLPVLLGKYGEEGDKLLFRLLRRGASLGRALEAGDATEADLADLGLRYDLTVPLARVVAQHRDLPRFFRRYQIQPVWRADRPARGRFREFFQCDADIIGATGRIAEAEVCAAVTDALDALGFENVTLRINHRELLRGVIAEAGIPPEAESTALVALDKRDKIGDEGVLGELVERGIDEGAGKALLALCASPEPGADPVRAIGQLRERLATEAGQRGADELAALFSLLAKTPAAAGATFAPQLARGLSYYTGPIFELGVPDLAGSLGGGGRYDGLIGMFGKAEIPAVGCSLGLERILLVMEERGMMPSGVAGPDVMLCWMPEAERAALAMAGTLRAANLATEIYPEAHKLKKQLQYAAGIEAKAAAILGESEVASGRVTLKHLASGEQREVAVADAAATIKGWS